MALLLLKVCAVVYFVGAVVGFIQMFAHRWAYERIGAVGLALGAVSHVVALVVRAVDLGSFPMANTHDGISLFAFTAAVCGSVIAFRGARSPSWTGRIAPGVGDGSRLGHDRARR